MYNLINYDNNDAHYQQNVRHENRRNNANKNRSIHAEGIRKSLAEKEAIGKRLIRILKDSDTNELIRILDGAPFVGCGAYNVIYQTMIPGVVMRTSLYSPAILHSVSSFMIQPPKDGSSLKPAKFTSRYRADVDANALAYGRKVLESDSVRIKNNMSHFTNMLVKQRICPHFVFMYAELDTPAFGKNIGMLRYNKDFRRYTNVSFHDRYTSSLEDAISTARIDGNQLRAVIFQVLHGLMVLQHYLPGFRHNDLSLKNVLVSITDPKPDKASCYTVYGPTGGLQKVMLPDVGVHAAITDFDLCHAPVRFVHFKNPKDWGIKTGATLENVAIENNERFQNKDAKELLRNAFVPSFDVFIFLKNIHFCLYQMRAKQDQDYFKFAQVMQWLESFMLFDAPEFARARYTHVDIPRLHPINVINMPFIRPSSDPRHAARCSESWDIKELPYAIFFTGNENDREMLRESIKGMTKTQAEALGVPKLTVLPGDPYFRFGGQYSGVPFARVNGGFFVDFFAGK